MRIFNWCNTYSFALLSALNAKNPPVAFLFKGLDSSLQISSRRPVLTSVEQCWQDEWFVEFNLCRKTDRFVFQLYYCLVMAESACTSQIFISFHNVASLASVDSKYFYLLNSSTTSSSCFLQPFSELLQFFFTASQKIDIVSKPQVAKRSSSDVHWREWCVNFFCILFCIICKLFILGLPLRC